MRASVVRSLALGFFILAGSRAASAEGYWNYTYKDFDVTAAGNKEYAVTLAHNIARFDKALGQILQLPDIHVTTHVYMLPGKEVKTILGDEDANSYQFSGYEVTTVASPGAERINRDYGALFGYAGGLLVNGRASRAPYWFQVGVPALFANTQFEGDRIKTGGMSPGWGRVLMEGPLIPMRTFLRLQARDPQLNDSSYAQKYEAEAWYLAREVFVEAKLRSEFSRYLTLIRDGKSEEDAFSASFKISYEDLDKFLLAAMREPLHVFIIPVPLETADQGTPQQLGEAEVKGRLADLNLRWLHRPVGLQLASEALRLDPKNETALRVSAQANLQEGNFDAALAAVDRLIALSSPSPAALTDCGSVLAGLARAVSRKQASVGTDADVLSQRAIQAYRRALDLDAEYLRAWAGLAYVYGSKRDAAAAKELVPKAQAVMEKHPYSGALARALAEMCAQTGQTQDAFVFAEFWRTDSINRADLDYAETFISRLKAHPPAEAAPQTAAAPSG